MRAVIQRVARAAVKVDSEMIASIGKGLLVLVGLHSGDGTGDMEYIIRKILNLRIFDDDSGQMNLPVTDAGGEILVVSQFTLYGSAHKGNRPSYSEAMNPPEARIFFQRFLDRFRQEFPGIRTGEFGARMEVELVNSGPVTILVDSSKIF